MKPNILTSVLDLISPRACVMCGRRLTAAEDVVCIGCMTEIPFCDFSKNYLDNPMSRLFWGQFPIERATALFYYHAQSAPYRMIHALKYHDSPYIGIMLGKATAQRVQPHGFFDDIDAIVPMPITWQRRWHRGYNQSEAIAQGIGLLTGLPVYKKVVKRTSFSESQTHKNFQERKKNVENAFLLRNADKVKGKHILLVDDVLTTGATITACAKELCKAGDIRISVMTIGLTKE